MPTDYPKQSRRYKLNSVVWRNFPRVLVLMFLYPGLYLLTSTLTLASAKAAYVVAALAVVYLSAVVWAGINKRSAVVHSRQPKGVIDWLVVAANCWLAAIFTEMILILLTRIVA